MVVASWASANPHGINGRRCTTDPLALNTPQSIATVDISIRLNLGRGEVGDCRCNTKCRSCLDIRDVRAARLRVDREYHLGGTSPSEYYGTNCQARAPISHSRGPIKLPCLYGTHYCVWKL